MKNAKGKTWREKLEKDQKRKVVTIPPKMQKRFGRGKMLIPKPLDVTPGSDAIRDRISSFLAFLQALRASLYSCLDSVFSRISCRIFQSVLRIET